MTGEHYVWSIGQRKGITNSQSQHGSNQSSVLKYTKLSIPAVTASTHALFDLALPERLPEFTARIMTALIAMKHNGGFNRSVQLSRLASQLGLSIAIFFLAVDSGVRQLH